jgi:tRNA-splicing ligase RtcB
MSRHAPICKIRGRDLRAQLAAQEIEVRAHTDRGLAEEARFSYRDVDEVVATCERAGLARRVARLRPIGAVKG